jgi:hypothetical protein
VPMLGAAGSLLAHGVSLVRAWVALVAGITFFIPCADFIALLVSGLWTIATSIIRFRRNRAAAPTPQLACRRRPDGARSDDVTARPVSAISRASASRPPALPPLLECEAPGRAVGPRSCQFALVLSVGTAAFAGALRSAQKTGRRPVAVSRARGT